MASEARKAFELHPKALPRDILVQLYAAYNPRVKDAPLFVERAIQSFPNGACGVSSLYVQYLLDGAGDVAYGTYGRAGHSFLVFYETGLIADITSDQFGGPPVYVGCLQDPWRLVVPAY